MTFILAIVGRPNVGKSTLFNRLVGRRLALVDDTPGVTRDRREGVATLYDMDFKVVDTAGLEESPIESLSGRMRAQTETAITMADAVLFMIDARAGIMPADRGFAELVRKSGKRAILVANKSEGRAGEAGLYEAYSLGLGDPVAMSAEHGEGLGELHEALLEIFPRAESDPDEPVEDEAPSEVGDFENRPIRVAVVGRPNAGKSTLINRLLGEDRLLTGPEAGITRDAISVPLTWRDKSFLLHDTAGMRRKARIDEKLEKLSVSNALDAIRFAEVVVLLMDATTDFEEQDLRIADLVEREGRALVIGMNKWDLKPRSATALAQLREDTDRWLPQIAGVPVVTMSGLTGEGLEAMMEAVVGIHAMWNKRISTNPLNRWLEDATAAHPPPATSGRRLKLNYMTQAKARPPSFVLFCTRADAVPDAYQRYLINSLRKTFEMPGVPIRLMLREKKNPYAGKR